MASSGGGGGWHVPLRPPLGPALLITAGYLKYYYIELVFILEIFQIRHSYVSK